MNLSKKSIVLGLLLSFTLLPTISNTYAQESETDFGVAFPITIELEEGQVLEDGMIVTHSGNSYKLSTEPYDRNIIGSVNLFPRIEFTGGVDSDKTPIISSGVSPVLVSGENGPILDGDIVTASSVAGIGMKAKKSGFTLGIATENFDGTTIDDQGVIGVRVGATFTFSDDTPDSKTVGDRLRDVVSLSAIAAIDEPLEVFKYFTAGIILIGSILIAFISFSRTSQKGIEALGRNPLARSSIITGIFVNILISIIIISAGVAGAYFMVTL